jgi:hypothetical protein
LLRPLQCHRPDRRRDALPGFFIPHGLDGGIDEAKRRGDFARAGAEAKAALHFGDERFAEDGRSASVPALALHVGDVLFRRAEKEMFDRDAAGIVSDVAYEEMRRDRTKMRLPGKAMRGRHLSLPGQQAVTVPAQALPFETAGLRIAQRSGMKPRQQRPVERRRFGTGEGFADERGERRVGVGGHFVFSGLGVTQGASRFGATVRKGTQRPRRRIRTQSGDEFRTSNPWVVITRRRAGTKFEIGPSRWRRAIPRFREGVIQFSSFVAVRAIQRVPHAVRKEIGSPGRAIPLLIRLRAPGDNGLETKNPAGGMPAGRSYSI